MHAIEISHGRIKETEEDCWWMDEFFHGQIEDGVTDGHAVVERSEEQSLHGLSAASRLAP